MIYLCGDLKQTSNTVVLPCLSVTAAEPFVIPCTIIFQRISNPPKKATRRLDPPRRQPVDRAAIRWQTIMVLRSIGDFDNYHCRIVRHLPHKFTYTCRIWKLFQFLRFKKNGFSTDIKN